MNSLLLVALAGATFASEIGLDTPEQFIKDKKHAKYSQSVPSEALTDTLNKPAGTFSLSADAEPTAEAAASPEADADAWYGYYGYGLHRPYGYGYYGYRPYRYGKRSAELDAEAQPLQYYAPYSYPYFYRPYAASGYAGGFGKRSADADPAVLAGASRIISAPTPLIHNPPVRPVISAPVLGYASLPYAAPEYAVPSHQALQRLHKREADYALHQALANLPATPSGQFYTQQGSTNTGSASSFNRPSGSWPVFPCVRCPIPAYLN